MSDTLVEYSEDDLTRYLEVATRMAEEAGKMIAKAINEPVPEAEKGVTLKDSSCAEGNASSVLTETDSAVEKLIVEGIRSAFPGHKFIGEEDISASPTGMVETFTNGNIWPFTFTWPSFPSLEPTWIIDPIDGTMNFIHRNPLVCTSIGLTINK